MLVLTRRKNQSIIIGDGITITVLEVKGDNIRIGIDAPRDVQVFREELLTAVSQANTSAVLPTDPAELPTGLPTAPTVPGAPSRAAAVPTRPATGTTPLRPTPLRLARKRSA